MNTAGRAGSTLVEVMFSCLILAIIAIAGAAYLAQATATLDVQRNRMSALATANRYMDEWRGTPWAVVTNRVPSSSYVTNYVNRTGFCSWSSGSSSKLGGSVTNNGVTMTVTNTLSYFDADGGSLSYDCVNVSVSVMDAKRPDSVVVMRTLLSPP